ncbi:hypothetical protein SAMN05421874_10213 [Nonomuraea maritima]|uniref:Uncharacterized protein n=1 Tax=Nonomuraea maritima TaxID=683260 RepID=A0A1G8U8R4_9ACTN|nr:hypothetical protein [Nonomuraea maritima]SDJ50137.1 hypothetical protein SAMN05421874_10213 [Nonomuraea maritima]
MRVDNVGHIHGDQHYNEYNWIVHGSADNLEKAHTAFTNGEYGNAERYYREYLAEAAAPSPETLVEYVLVLLGRQLPRDHTPARVAEILRVLDAALRSESAPPSAAALWCLMEEDLCHAQRRAPHPDLPRVQDQALEVDLQAARLICELIPPCDCPTWRMLNAYLADESDAALDDPEPAEPEAKREKHMKTFFGKAPRRPASRQFTPEEFLPQQLEPISGSPPNGPAIGTTAAAGALVWWLSSGFLSFLILVGAVWLVSKLVSMRNNHRRIARTNEEIERRNAQEHTEIQRRNAESYEEIQRENARRTAAYKRRLARYRRWRPSADQLEQWFRADLEAARARALDRLGLVAGQLVDETGREQAPLVVTGPVRNSRLRRREPGGPHYPDRFSVFVLVMTQQKVGAYQGTVDFVTGRRGAVEKTCEFRYKDIVSISVRSSRREQKAGNPPEYTVVGDDQDRTLEVPLEEEFVLIVPGDRFSVVTTLMDEQHDEYFRLYSQADQALAVIRQRLQG